MLLQVIIIAILTILSFLLDKRKCLFLIMAIIPFHAFIKYLFIFYSGGGTLFSFWKEIVIVIFMIRSLSAKGFKIRFKYKPIFAILIFFVTLYLIVGMDLPNYAMVSYRDIIFPLIMFIAISMNKFDEKFISTILFIYAIDVILVGISGALDIFGNLRPFFATISQKIMVSSNGEIYYPASMVIMGYNRMTGIMEGPNQLGLYCSLYLIVYLYSMGKLKFTKIKKVILHVAMICAIMCILLSFSRTGWALTFIAIALLYKNKIKYLIATGFVLILCGGALLLINQEVSDTVQDVVGGTFRGKEASAADRGNNLQKGIDFVIAHPFGSGLGHSQAEAYEKGKPNAYFAESTFVNYMVEMGGVGLILIILFYVRVARCVKQLNIPVWSALAKVFIYSTIIISFFSVNPGQPSFTYVVWIFIGIPFALANLKLSKNEIINRWSPAMP